MRLLAALLLLTTAASAQTLERIRTTKALTCGINAEEGDYSRTDDHGTREVFDRDLCTAVAVAILGTNAKVVLKPFPDDVTAAAALQSHEVDLLPTHTLDFTHATEKGIGFSSVILWDGVGFMVPVASGITRPEQLTGKKICLLDNTEVEEVILAWNRRMHVKANPFPYQEEGEMEAGFVTGGCTAMAGDLTRLAAIRIGFGEIAPKFRVLPGAISKDPLASAYLRSDERFGWIVNSVIQVLVAAEESGITKTTPQPDEADPTTQRILGKTHELGARLGLADDWAMRVLGTVGNYGEIYERDLGPHTDMGLERGWNRLSSDGGLITAPPIK